MRGRSPARWLCYAWLLGVVGSACDTHTAEVLTVASVELSSLHVTLPVGQSEDVQVRLMGAGGVALSGHSVSWRSADTAVATVLDGRITGRTVGEGLVIATAGGQSATVTVTVTGASLRMQPSAVALTGTTGGPLQNTSIAVQDVGQLAAEGLAVHVSAGATAWLSAALSGPSAPATLTIEASPATLPAGLYSGWVVVTPTNGQPDSVHVDFTVTDAGAAPVTLEPQWMDVVAIQTSVSDTGYVSVRVDDGQLERENLTAEIDPASLPANWLWISLDRSSTPATLVVGVEPKGMAPGTYRADVLVRSGGVIVATFPVSLVVPQPTESYLQADPDSVSFQVTTERTTDRAQVALSSGPVSANDLAATVLYDPGASGWLAAALDGTETPTALRLSVDADGLSPGNYRAVVRLTSSNGPALDVPVRVRVDEEPVIGVPTTHVTLNATLGLDPAPTVLAVANVGLGQLTGLNATVSYDPGDGQGWLTASLSESSAPTLLTLGASVPGLPAGTYGARVTLTGVLAQPVVIQVTLVITGGPLIGLNPLSVQFSAQAGGPDPSPINVFVTNLDVGLLTGLAVSIEHAPGEPAGWLAATLAASFAPTVLTLEAEVGTLAPGVYRATVTVTSAVARTSELDVLFVVSGS